MKRIYEAVIKQHIEKYEQMAFLCGPRQVGKTTIARHGDYTNEYSKYLNWDSLEDRERILKGDKALLEGLPMDVVLPNKPVLILDEIHKYKEWKTLVKGLIDEYKGDLSILVTGSARLNAFRSGGDSLAGRYFLYHIHPLSVAELQNQSSIDELILAPSEIKTVDFDALFKFGGFPEPFLKQEESFYNRWQNLRQQQIIREDIRDLAQIQEIAQLEMLAFLLQRQTGQLANYSKLANKIRVSDTTIRRWIKVLESFYYVFSIKPWSNNVSRSLLKEPKLYLWDWSVVQDKGAKVENFVACHLFKAVHFWEDIGLGKFDLYFLRDKDKREVDFLVTKNEKPWILLEVKSSAKEPLSKNLQVFQNQINAEHVLQLAFDLPYVEQDFRELKKPKIMPVKTFLSQLV